MKNNIIQEIELQYNTTGDIASLKLDNSKITYDVLLKCWNLKTIGLQEEFKIIYLNRANDLIGIYNHSKGGMNSTIADVRLIIAVALKCAASSIILAHNHPSGNLTPSPQDKKLTNKIKECCATFDILLLDHILVSSKGYYSFVEEGDL